MNCPFDHAIAQGKRDFEEKRQLRARKLRATARLAAEYSGYESDTSGLGTLVRVGDSASVVQSLPSWPCVRETSKPSHHAELER